MFILQKKFLRNFSSLNEIYEMKFVDHFFIIQVYCDQKQKMNMSSSARTQTATHPCGCVGCLNCSQNKKRPKCVRPALETYHLCTECIPLRSQYYEETEDEDVEDEYYNQSERLQIEVKTPTKKPMILCTCAGCQNCHDENCTEFSSVLSFRTELCSACFLIYVSVETQFEYLLSKIRETVTRRVLKRIYNDQQQGIIRTLNSNNYKIRIACSNRYFRQALDLIGVHVPCFNIEKTTFKCFTLNNARVRILKDFFFQHIAHRINIEKYMGTTNMNDHVNENVDSNVNVESLNVRPKKISKRQTKKRKRKRT